MQPCRLLGVSWSLSGKGLEDGGILMGSTLSVFWTVPASSRKR